MARIYSRGRGKAGSTKPSKTSKHTWITYGPKEIEMLIVKLAKEKTPSQIGFFLRDSYGIPDVKSVIGKSVTEVLKEKNVLPEVPEDLMALMRTTVKIRKHLEDNKHDMTAKRGMIIAESKIKRLVKYYKREKRLPVDWKYDPAKVRLVLE